jgi:dTDP-glucose 4,6-dehydratase/UDP-glucose 4-epimerase
MHYFITGGSGFIGSALVKRLLRDGNKVTVYDNNARGNVARLPLDNSNLIFIEGDIRDVVKVIESSKDSTSFIHMAAINGTDNFYKHPELVLDVGIRGMLSAVEACRANGIKELVLASSSEVYQSAAIIPTPENVPLIIPDIENPRYSYGGSKIASELILQTYGRTGFDRAFTFRPHNVYGPDMGWKHVLPQFILRASELQKSVPQGVIPFKIHGDGTQTRSFIYIDDFIDALVLLLKSGNHLETYHIGTVDEVTIKDVAEKIGDFFGRKIKIEAGDTVLGETSRRCPDITKIKGMGFSPKVGLDEGLRKTIGWYMNNQPLQSDGIR